MDRGQTNLPALFDHLVAGVVVHDRQGRVVGVNPRACALMGLSAEQMIGRAADASWRLLDEAGQPLPVDQYPVNRVLAEGRALVNMVVGVPRKDAGATAWLLCNAYVEGAAEVGVGEPAPHVVMMLLDATDTIEGQRALAASERRFRLIYENTVDAVLLTLPDGSVVAANPAAQMLFGLTEEELIQRGREGLCDLTDERLATLLKERLAHGHAAGRFRMIRGDGVRIEVEATATLYESDGHLMSALVLRDASLRDRLEQIALDQQVRARTSAERASFLARVSHELRTPLNAIVGLTSVMIDAPDPAPAASLRAVLSAAEHLSLLVDDLLDWGLSEGGDLRLEPAPTDVHDAIRELVEQAQPIATPRRITLRADMLETPCLVTLVDRRRLRQVLWNLLSNAIKYNREGGSVTVRLHRDAARFAIDVADSGCGMTAAQLSRIFIPFERLGHERSEIRGTGIGLAVTHQIVQAMGGSITVDSAPDQGTTFTVELPLAAASSASAPQPDSAHRDPATSGERLLPAALDVLCIDDDDVNRAVMRQMVALSPGWTWREAPRAQHGLALARERLPDVLFVDLVMPEMDGWDLLQAVREDATTRGIACVAVSALASADDRQRARLAGFDGYLVKPVSLAAWREELLRVLSDRLEQPH